MKKDLILGLINNYPFEWVRPFLSSLRATGYKGEVRFFVTRASSDTLDLLRREGVEVIPFFHSAAAFRACMGPTHRKSFIHRRWDRLCYRALRDPLQLARLLLPVSSRHPLKAKAAALYMPSVGVRNALYYAFLKEQGHRYRRVMFTDLKDVVFQADPFAFDWKDEVTCFWEDAYFDPDPRNPCRNSQWMRYGYGPKTALSFKGARVTCSGINYGSPEKLMEYAYQMYRAMESKAFEVDQAVHNYLIHKGIFVPGRIMENFQGPVLTMGTIPQERLSTDPQGYLHNEDGSLINVLHHYDRFPAEFRANLAAWRAFVKSSPVSPAG